MVLQKVNDNGEKCQPKYRLDNLKAKKDCHGLVGKEARKPMKSEKVTIKKGAENLEHWVITKLQNFFFTTLQLTHFIQHTEHKINLENEEQYLKVHSKFSLSIDE